MSDEIRLIFDDYKADILREMADAVGLETTQNGKKLPKDALLEKLHGTYFTAARIEASYAKLSKIEQAVLNRLLLRDGEVATSSLRREVVRAGLVTQGEEPAQKRSSYYRSPVPYADGYIGQPHRVDSTIFEDVLARLTYHGLVFSKTSVLSSGNTTYKMQYHPGTILYIPAVVRQHLPQPEPIPPEVNDWQPAKILAADPSLFLRDLYLHWDFVRQNEVSMLKNGMVAKRSLKAINDTLLVPDPMVENAQREDDTGRLYLLRQLLEELGLLHIKQGRLQPAGKNPLKIDPFWQLHLAEQMSDCLEAWSNVTGFKDVWGEQAKKYGLRLIPARSALLNVLKTQPAHIWLDPGELLEQLWAKDINFLIPDHSSVEDKRSGSYYYSRYSSSYFYGTPRELLKIFEQLEAEFVNACLSGFLYQLGVVELGQETESASPGQIQTWQAFRLTPLGRAALRQDSAAELPAGHTGKVVIQPNFQIMALGPVGLDVLAQLDMFADREQVDRGAFQYRLSRDSVYRAQQSDLPVTDIIAFLENQGHAELPQNVRRSLDEWAGHHQRIVFRCGIDLLQAANSDLLEKLRQEPSTGKFLTRPVTREVALVKPSRQPQLSNALLEQGFLPAVSGANPEAADRSVTVEPDGTIHPIHAVPSLHLRGRLMQIAEEKENGAWQLTPASVRRAGGSRNKVNRLLNELAKLHRGSLPDSLVTQLKAWGGYYGQANTETLTLLEFSDATTLAELGQHPALQAHLTPFSAGNRSLAIVPAEKLEQVKQVLAEFGIPVKEGLAR